MSCCEQLFLQVIHILLYLQYEWSYLCSFNIAVYIAELTKKDMIKLLSHSNHDLKLLGWSYVSNVLAWLLRVFSEASVSRSGDAESVLIDHGFFRVLPDMAFILSVRSG